MHRKDLLHQLESYFASPLMTTEEMPFYYRIIEFMQKNPDCFERFNPGHITASAWLLNHDLTHVLLTHHKKFDRWVQLGGHCDGNSDTQEVALQEAQEESGIEDLTFLIDGIYDIDVHDIPGKCIAHYDIRYLLVAPADAAYIVSDESHDLKWIAINKVKEYSSERSVIRLAEKFKKHKF